jgi:hypothetical protein
VLAVLSGLSLLIFDAVTATIDGDYASEIRGIRQDLGMEEDTTTMVLSEIVLAFGSAIGTIFYLIIVHYIAVFFEGKGDLSDHLHMNLSVDVVYNLLAHVTHKVSKNDVNCRHER